MFIIAWRRKTISFEGVKSEEKELKLREIQILVVVPNIYMWNIR